MYENKPRKIIVHHSADPSSGNQLEKIDLHHKKRGFQKRSFGYYVGYHYLIERDGSLVATRREDEEGAHTKGHNLESLGICLAGDFDVQSPTALQTLQLVTLIDRLVKIWQIPLSDIYPHRSFAVTSCYGLGLSNDWAREEYRNYVIANIKHTILILKGMIEILLGYVKK